LIGLYIYENRFDKLGVSIYNSVVFCIILKYLLREPV